MVRRLAISSTLGFLLVFAAGLLLASMASAHASGVFHWHMVQDFYGVWQYCLYTPSGAFTSICL